MSALVKTSVGLAALIALAGASLLPALAQTAPSPRPQAADADLASTLDGIVQKDARSWYFNHYDSGSVSHVEVTSQPGGRRVVVQGEYTFNSGLPGWVKVQLLDGEPECLEFWDFPGRCRPLGESYSHVLAAAFATALIESSLSGASAGSGGDDGQVHNCRTDPGALCQGEHLNQYGERAYAN